MEQQRQLVDWTGRILSLVSLIVAIGIGAYVITQGQVSQTRDELRAEFGQELQGMITAYEQKRNALEKEFTDSLDRNDQRMSEWNQQLVTAIDSFDRDSKRLLNDIAAAESRASETRLADFRQELVQLRRLAVSSPGDDSSLDDDSTADTTDTPDQTQLAVHTVLKVIPSDTQDEVLIRIENSANEDALIQRIQFKPESDFRVASGETSTDYSDTDSILVFSFDASDNTSSKPGHHGLYNRKLSRPIRIPAGETMTMRVVIDSSEHVGWGFAGQLRLDYNADEPLLIKTARVQFEKLEDPDALDLTELLDRST